jgi:hypothetical protein
MISMTEDEVEDWYGWDHSNIYYCGDVDSRSHSS